MQSDFDFSPRSSLDGAAQTTPRHDLYGPVHKGLRAFMNATLESLGSMDVGDAASVTASLGQLRSLLSTLHMHLEIENRFVHPAIESRETGGAARTAGDHEEHLRAIAGLGAQADGVEEAAAAGSVARATALTKQLYLHLSCFIAENLEHMHFEETENARVLWETHSDAEIAEIEQSIIASETPEQIALTMRWMLPAMSPAERARLVGGARVGMPAEVFQGFLGLVRGVLDARDYEKLLATLGLDPGRA